MPRATAETAARSASLQERKHLLVKSAIWDAATDLFLEKGYEETTVDEIADRAGISRRSFFRYYASKSDLMGSGIVEYAGFITDAIKASPPGSSVPEVVRNTVLHVAQHCAALPRTRKAMQIVTQYPAVKDALHSRSAELHERVDAAFAARGRAFRDLPPGVLAGLTLAVLDVVFHLWFRQSEQDIQTSASQVLATLGRMAHFDALPHPPRQKQARQAEPDKQVVAR